MDPSPATILDISSDDDEPAGWDDRRGDGLDWLVGVLGAAVGAKVPLDDDDSDDVMVLGEVKSKQQRSKSTKPAVADDDDDDECVVLDGDPDKQQPADAAAAVDDGDDVTESDEVMVVGQKGQIACRDFPHPRHACANYPFSSTPHEKYCDMCHCYVCDSRAPCAYWCVGVSSIDHCHANHKEEIWKSQREYFKTGKRPPPAVSKPLTANLNMLLPQLNRPPLQNIVHLAPNSMPRNRFSQTPLGVRACSSSTGVVGIPSSRTRCRIQQSRTILNNNGFQPRSQQLLGVRNNVIRRDRGLSMGNRSPQVISANNTTSRSPRIATNLSGYAPLNNSIVAHGLQYGQNPPSASANGWQNVPSGISLEVYTQQPNVAGFVSAAPSPSHRYTHHIPSENVGHNRNVFNCRNQTNVNQFTSETTQPIENRQSQTFHHQQQQQQQQQHVVKEFPPNKLLSEFEDWLLDNHPILDGSLSEPATLDEDMLSFDFEAFLND